MGVCEGVWRCVEGREKSNASFLKTPIQGNMEFDSNRCSQELNSFLTSHTHSTYMYIHHTHLNI